MVRKCKNKLFYVQKLGLVITSDLNGRASCAIVIHPS